METWHTIYITDKNKGIHFKVNASPASTLSEIRNLKSHLKQARKYPNSYNFLDIATAIIILDGEPYNEIKIISDCDLLSELYN